MYMCLDGGISFLRLLVYDRDASTLDQPRFASPVLGNGIAVVSQELGRRSIYVTCSKNFGKSNRFDFSGVMMRPEAPIATLQSVLAGREGYRISSAPL